MNISIVELCGQFCVDPNKAIPLYALIGSALERGEPVVLDFTGVRVLTSTFLNSAIGCLYGAYPADTIEGQLSFTGLDETDATLIPEVQNNARRFYALPADQRTRLIEAENHFVENG